MQDKYILLDDDDNIACALEYLKKGTTFNVKGMEIAISKEIPQGHKFAIKKIGNGEDIFKYGYKIGKASRDICPGEYVHVDEVIDLVKNWHEKYNELIQREDIKNV